MSPATISLAVALGTGFWTRVVDLAARRGHSDTAATWARSLAICGVLAIILFLHLVSESMWSTRGFERHLLADRAGYGLPLEAHVVAAVVPALLWGVGSLVSAVALSPDPSSGRWLVGGISYSGSRVWLAWMAVPIGLLIAISWYFLTGPPMGFPAGVWTLLWCAFWSLLSAAMSGPGRDSEAVGEDDREVVDWLEAMREQGFTLTTLGVVPSEGAIADGASERARARVEQLFGDEGAGTALLVRSSDEGRQFDFVASAANRAAMGRLRTLVITPAGGSEACCRLQERLGELRVGVIPRRGPLGASPDVMVAEADVVSDRLELILEPRRAARVGLLVWWDAHRYSGVLAANVWALSRRVQRLVRARAHSDTRTLICARRDRQAAAEAQSFLHRLFPYRLDASSTVNLSSPSHASARLHLLDTHGAFAAAVRGLPDLAAHPAAVTAAASAQLGFPTHHRPTGMETDDEVGQAWSEIAPTTTRSLSPDRADVSIGEATTEDVVALPNRLSSLTGTRVTSHRELVLVRPRNPYLRWRTEGLQADALLKGPGFTPRLVGAKGHARIVERHLLLALQEMPDVKRSLEKAAFMDEPVLRGTLRSLAKDGQLVQTEVLYVRGGTVQRDVHYRNQGGTRRSTGSLRVVDHDAVPIEELGGEEDHEIVRAWVDPRRLPIEAYPGRVFCTEGRRYRVESWTEADVRRGARIECRIESRAVRTWRIGVSELRRTELRASEELVQSRGRLRRGIAKVRFHELVNGWITEETDLVTGTTTETEQFCDPITAEFDTMALLLGFPEDVTIHGAIGVAEAMRHVLPVHVRVEADAVAIVPMPSAMGDRGAGVAVVDTFPGGIGLVDDLFADGPLLFEMLAEAHAWLAACACDSDDGCYRCVRDVSSRAASRLDLPSRRGALAALRPFGASDNRRA